MEKVYDFFSIKKFNTFFWDFKPEIYKEIYSDIRQLNTIQLMKHYFYVGRFQRRIYNKGIKIIIVCEPWNDNGQFSSGANKALYNLAKQINEKKYKNIYAKMYVMTRQNLQNPFCNFFAYDNEINSRTLVIYPDGNYGNPLKAKNVMRWILLEVGTIYRPISIIRTWHPNELVYHWEQSKIAQNIKILNNCIIDKLFQNYFQPRKPSSSCYLIKKRKIYTQFINYIHPYDSICLDNLSKSQIINYFNECEYFYCYDLKTFFTIGAIICGCKVILVPDDNSKENYILNSVFNNFPKKNNLFAWGNDDIKSINYTQEDINDFISYLDNLSNSVNNFLEDIANYFYFNNYNFPTVKSVYKNYI